MESLEKMEQEKQRSLDVFQGLKTTKEIYHPTLPN